MHLVLSIKSLFNKHASNQNISYFQKISIKLKFYLQSIICYCIIKEPFLEGCPSGLKCALGKRVWGNPPQVRILSPPPYTKSTNYSVRTFFVTEEYFGICVYFGTKKNLYDIIKTWNG